MFTGSADKWRAAVAMAVRVVLTTNLVNILEYSMSELMQTRHDDGCVPQDRALALRKVGITRLNGHMNHISDTAGDRRSTRRGRTDLTLNTRNVSTEALDSLVQPEIAQKHDKAGH